VSVVPVVLITCSYDKKNVFGQKNSYRCLFSTATKEKKKARGRKITDGWIDRKETVGVVGWWGGGLFPVRVQVYISVVQVKTLGSEKKTEKRAKTIP